MRDIVVHQAGNAEELARVLGAHLAGEPVATRGFEEREAPLRALNDADLWDALQDRMAALNEVAEAGRGGSRRYRRRLDRPHHESALVRRAHARGTRPARLGHHRRLTMPSRPGPACRALDDDAQRLCGGAPAARKGAKGLRPGERIEARLRVAGTAQQDRRRLSADTDQTTSRWPTPKVRPHWKPMPRRECCCYGAVDRQTRRGSVAASGPKPWAGCVGCSAATDRLRPQ